MNLEGRLDNVTQFLQCNIYENKNDETFLEVDVCKNTIDINYKAMN